MQANPRVHSIFLGLFLIMAGVIVFLINLGYGSWELIWQVWRLWPVLIIFIGIRIIWQGPSAQWLTYGFWLLVALGIIILLVSNPRTGNPEPPISITTGWKPVGCLADWKLAKEPGGKPEARLS